MTRHPTVSPWRVLLPIGLGTALSLIGDASLYVVLPTHMVEAGVSLGSVGILLSANRFIRLVLNGPAGLAYDHWPRRRLFVPALFVGACSTAIYGLTQGFWPLLVGRLLWGLAWAGIWVGGNAIILDITRPDNRGRWVGIYQTSFFLGASSGAIIGGLLTDLLGYHRAMVVAAGLTLLGAIITLLFLPETRNPKQTAIDLEMTSSQPANASKPARWAEFGSAIALLGVNRLVIAGILLPTFGLFLLELMGDSIQLANISLGVATVTGIGLGATGLISMAATPAAGGISDRVGDRWQVAAGGLTPGIAGFSLLAFGSPLAALIGLPLTAITSGSNQSLSTAIVGDLSDRLRRGRQLGLLFTIGDLASAVGPPLAYALIPRFGVKGVYLLSAGLLMAMFVVALRWAVRLKRKSLSSEKSL